MRFSTSLLLVASACARATTTSHRLDKRVSANDTWYLGRFNSLITFGDSYTDENRLAYFGAHNGSAPPAGTYLNESLSTSDGGRIWARYVIQYTGATVSSVWTPAITLYNYAVSGAVCSNNLSPRTWATTNAPFPDLDLYEVPAFLADKNSTNSVTGKAYFTPALTASDAVYAIWDGTNDLGADAYLTDSQARGTTLVDYTNCIFTQVDRLYASGGRYFVLMNVLPLNLVAMYANASYGGLGPTKYWTTAPANLTATEERMEEEVGLVNEVSQYRLPYEVLVANKYPDANFALFDVHGLVMDLHGNPTVYFNGSAPANVTGFVNHCSLAGTNCVASDSPDSFLWYDELHPSEQTGRIIAREFVNVISGNSSYATYY